MRTEVAEYHDGSFSDGQPLADLLLPDDVTATALSLEETLRIRLDRKGDIGTVDDWARAIWAAMQQARQAQAV